jgi:pimeloyl-ACP methyl ester carboxylesterase
MKKVSSLVLLIGFLFAQPLQADRLVLVQGYLAKSSSWHESGIAQVLVSRGWSYGGEFYLASDGARTHHPAFDADTAQHVFYSVSIPTEAPVQLQSYYLGAYLKRLRQLFPDEPVTLVGHSAGGVVARYTMVKLPGLKINRLITIASPHLGTDRAELGRLAGDTPLSLIAPLVGAGTLNRSQGLYNDLLPEMPRRMLFWLNRQSHPEAEYISIVRDQESNLGGDWVVAQESQYLENVAALQGRAISYVVPATHKLTRADGWLILDIIEERVLRPL